MVAFSSHSFHLLPSLSKYQHLNLLNQHYPWYFATAFGLYALASFLQKQFKNRLSQKHVIVLTGCDSGLGYSLAKYYHAQKVTVIAGVLSNCSPGALDLASMGLKVLELDVTDNKSVDKFGDEVERILRTERLQFYALVNNAGIMIFGESAWQLPSQIRSQFDVNVLGAIAVTNRFLSLLLPSDCNNSYSLIPESTRARIINVSSHCSMAPLPGLSAYSASKAALQAYSISLRAEMRKYKIDVVTFFPGSFVQSSNIMASQRKHFANMRTAMIKSDSKKRFCGNYFERYSEYFAAISNDNELRVIEDRKVYETFDIALRQKNPSFLYKCEPWRYTFYYFLFKITPTCMRDWLVERFVQAPKWEYANK